MIDKMPLFFGKNARFSTKADPFRDQEAGGSNPLSPIFYKFRREPDLDSPSRVQHSIHETPQAANCAVGDSGIAGLLLTAQWIRSYRQASRVLAEKERGPRRNEFTHAKVASIKTACGSGTEFDSAAIEPPATC
jgi:hypothetical protein